MYCHLDRETEIGLNICFTASIVWFYKNYAVLFDQSYHLSIDRLHFHFFIFLHVNIKIIVIMIGDLKLCGNCYALHMRYESYKDK